MSHIGDKVIDEARQGEAFVQEIAVNAASRKLYLESYGCSMNFSDSEIVASIMAGNGFATTAVLEEADLILLNTCAIRDNAESKIWQRLRQFKNNKRDNPDLIIGVLGCMAERL